MPSCDFRSTTKSIFSIQHTSITVKMKAYWYDNKEGDQREPHDSGRPVSEDYLASLGVIYHHLPELSDVDALAARRGYKNRDEIVVAPATMGNAYESKVKMFFAEHLHEDEEIRYIRDGEGYFDVRGKEDEWVRIRLVKDDLIILPAGIYHRFTTDDKNYIKAMRLFQEEPKWTPLNRGPELDDNQHRKTYLENLSASTVAAA
ncbi:acireductone dioxygenase (Ni2+-requiring) [Aspergillus undulatus]|uniref:acireductone dioxygenase (Ni2+-requiring) n=1 Tax=Aspergillus undulatus TaxID=1810928 RepID=UPI003CCCCFA7